MTRNITSDPEVLAAFAPTGTAYKVVRWKRGIFTPVYFTFEWLNSNYKIGRTTVRGDYPTSQSDKPPENAIHCFYDLAGAKYYREQEIRWLHPDLFIIMVEYDRLVGIGSLREHGVLLVEEVRVLLPGLEGVVAGYPDSDLRRLFWTTLQS